MVRTPCCFVATGAPKFNLCHLRKGCQPVRPALAITTREWGTFIIASTRMLEFLSSRGVATKSPSGTEPERRPSKSPVLGREIRIWQSMRIFISPGVAYAIKRFSPRKRRKSSTGTMAMKGRWFIANATTPTFPQERLLISQVYLCPRKFRSNKDRDDQASVLRLNIFELKPFGCCWLH